MTPRLTKWIPITPHPKQIAYLLAPHKEILFGGAAGGGKSEAGLAGFAQYADVPVYKGIIFRRTFRDLNLPGALMDRSHQWWDGTDAHFSSSDFKWRFPSGATLQFGYLEKERDKFRYQSAEFHYIFFDELTQFSSTQYTYLFSRLRKLTRAALLDLGIDFDIPLRMRAATNPGGVGHEWVKNRFIGSVKNPVVSDKRLYIPSRLEDNPSLDQDAYEESLMELDPVTRAQLRMGDWSADARGGKFKRHWFLDEVDQPSRLKQVLRYWDTAATSPKMGEDPDYTVGLKYAVDDKNEYWILDLVRFRGTPAENERLIESTAAQDGMGVEVWMEQEPGASGKHIIDHYRRNILPGYTFRAHRVSGSKDARANPVSGAAEGGIVHMVTSDWNEPFLDEAANFPDGAHDDQIDALSGAHEILSKMMRLEEVPKKATQRYAYSSG